MCWLLWGTRKQNWTRSSDFPHRKGKAPGAYVHTVSSVSGWCLLSGALFLGHFWPAVTGRPGAHQQSLIRAKDISITQKIPRNLGAFCQKLGAETNVCVSYCFIRVQARVCWVLSSRPHKAEIKVFPGFQSFLELGVLFLFTGCWSNSVPCGCWRELPIFLLLANWAPFSCHRWDLPSLPCGPLPSIAVCLCEASRRTSGTIWTASFRKGPVTFFFFFLWYYNLLFILYFYILFIILFWYH